MAFVKLTPVVAALVLAGCVAETAGDAGAPVQATRATTDQAQTVSLINAQRSRAGLPPVTADAQLQRAAQSHTVWMSRSSRLSHSGSGGFGIIARARAAGYDGCTVRENIAEGQPTADAVVAAWMGSTPHRANILADAATEVGLGKVKDADGNVWWTMVMGQPCDNA